MEDKTESVSFNKRRAEGNDKSERPKKNFQRNKRALNPTNTIAYVQFLGTGMDTLDTSPSVLLFFDKQRFIFNAGEGLQRFCTEHKIRLSKIDHIFLSRVCSETAGGIPGLLLTLAGMGEEGMSVNVWGPSDLKFLVDAMQNFIPNAAMVHTRSFGPTHGSVDAPMADDTKFADPIVLVDDEVVKLSAILLRPSFLEGSQRLNGVPIVQNPTEKVLDDRMDHASEHINLNSRSIHTGKPGDMSVIYVCELPEIKGKFDPVKAKALDVRPGPKYHELQLGNSVKLDNKNIMVHPSDVMGPSVPGPIVLLVDCPTESHFQELLSVQCLSSYYADFSGPPDNAKVVTCVIHLSPSSLISSSNYQRWMKRFGSAQHIMAGHERKNMEIPILKASARIAARLNYLCPQFFPAPGFWSLQDSDCLAPESTPSSEGSVCETISAENLLKFTLRPYAHLGLDRSVVPSKVAAADVIYDLLSENPEIVDAAQCVSQFWSQSTETKEEIRFMQEDTVMVEEPWFSENTLPSCLDNIRRDDMEIVLLGTGSSQPSKYRNVSAIHINLFSNGGLLLDCGEGTLGQLKRSKVAAADVIYDLLSENPEIVDAAQCVSQFWSQSTETKEEIRFMQEDTVMVEEPWFSENTLPSCLDNIRRDDMEIVLLGTGSSQPSKYRNVSAIHINLFSNGGLLLDCGEGTLGQLKRRYGVEGADNAVRGLRCIWISHIHADHHTGLARILALRRTLLKGVPHEPVLVVGPRQLKSYLDAYQRLEDLDMQFLDCRNTTDASLNAPSRATDSNKHHSSPGKDRQQKVDSTLFAEGSRMESYWKKPGSPVDDAVLTLQKTLSEAGLEALISVPVIHCSQAFGVVLKASKRLNSVGKVIPGWKLVYSGDTRPCPALIEASPGATILIHEATFEDGMEDEAIKKNHSTTEEAIEVGNSAGVYRVLLTHFSQRYPKIPVFDEAHMHKTCIAFDLMSINMADLPVLPKLLSYLKMLFKNEMTVDELD